MAYDSIKIFIIFAIALGGFVTVPLLAYSSTVTSHNTVTMQKEIWKDITGYKGLYQVSNLGNVKSLDRIIKRVDGKIKTFKGKVLKHRNCKGYSTICLTVNSNVKQYRVNRLVYGAFNLLDNNLVVDHIDNNPQNNRLNNLQQITQRKNVSKDKPNEFIGASKSGDRWRSRIVFSNKIKCLGTFDTPEEAHNAYKNELKIIENV